jgi:hypothetical protein
VTASVVAAGTSSTGIIVLAAQAKTVVVWPIPVIDAVTAYQGIATTFDVLTNDQTLPTGVGFSRTQLTDKPRAIGSARQTAPDTPMDGSITCLDGAPTRGLCTYRSSDLFSGTDGFDYSVSQRGRSWNVHVSVTVLPLAAAPVLQPDRAVATTGGAAVEIQPLVNDLGGSAGAAGNGGTLVIISSAPLPSGEGALTCSPVSCSYSPPSTDFVGTVTGHYSVVEQSPQGVNGPVSTASITIFVDEALLTPAGFSSAPSSSPAVSAGRWTETAVVATNLSHCNNGRPEASITWNANPRATSWTVQRRNVPDSVGADLAAWTTVVILPGATTSFLDNRVGETRIFQYRIRPDLYHWEGVYSAGSIPTTTPNATDAAGCS